MSQQTSTSPPVALVTGATSGIGQAVAIRLAADGATVIVHGRDAARGAATVKAIDAAAGRARSWPRTSATLRTWPGWPRRPVGWMCS